MKDSGSANPQIKTSNIKSRLFSQGGLVVFILSLLFFSVAVIHGWNGPINEIHAFRQTQTAITVSSLLKGGPWFSYETPVLGPPWSIPYEFPLYQWIVALVVKTGLFPIDQAGRFVSLASFLSALYPLFMILKSLRFKGNQIFLILSLLCISPQYIYWSRTFMIESLALALAAYYLWLAVLCLEDRNNGKWLSFIGLGIVGSLGGLVKITTFFGFVVAALFFFVSHAVGQSKAKTYRELILPSICFLIFAAIIPFFVVLFWTAYCDSIKLLNPMGKFLTSQGLGVWNFGTRSQKLSFDTWQLFYNRTITDILGKSGLAIISLLASLMCMRNRLRIVLLSLLLFVIPLCVFTNLQYVHNYYAYANGLFLILAMGSLIVGLWESGRYFSRITGVIIFVLAAIFSSSHYLKNYWPAQGSGYNYTQEKKDILEYTKESDLIIGFGEGWSSEIPYYLQRRAVMMPNFLPLNFNASYFKAMKRNIENYKIGAVAFTYDEKFDLPFISNALAEFNMQDSPIIKKYDKFRLYFRGSESK